MSEMVERLAKAIFDDEQKQMGASYSNEIIYGTRVVTWDDINDPRYVKFASDSFRQKARSYLATMRDPTEAMVEEGNRTGRHALESWQAMIDEALK